MALQFEITDNTGTALQDISSIASNKRYTPRLNLPWTASCRVPAHRWDTTALAGYCRLKIRDTDTTDILFNGMIWTVGDDGNENTAYTEITAIDPQGAYFPRRPARDADGDFSKPSFITDFVTAPQIMEEIINNSITWEGDMGIALGTFAGSGADVSGAPVDWPMTLADILALLTGTGELDVVPTPSDTTDGIMITLDGYNGDFGTDLTGSVSLDWGTGTHNVRSIRRTESMETICNKLFYYLGPRVKTSLDPAGDQHWKGNITGDGMPDGAGGSDPLPDPPGGDLDLLPNPLGDLIDASRTDFGVFMDIRIKDGEASLIPYLQARLWQTEMLQRVRPRTMLYMTPQRDYGLSFHIGDTVEVNAGTALRGGFSGSTQRVYAYTVAENDDGVTEIIDITTSADQEI